jgi:putative protease
MSTAYPQSGTELLAPAGDWECVRAAIENGADAIYFGLDVGFNARARAANFPLEDLPRLMQTLHLRGLKGYATLNVLVFSDELPEFARVIEAVAAAGVDAVLVQDVGAARLIKQICPELPLHASTQMTLTSAETIALAEKLGMERVVVARELSIDEILSIRKQTSMPLEVFVHGALCVAYSGQCLTSESLGGRSANRGQCAQACRLPYDLVCDGRDVDLGPQKYLLSPQDLAAYALAPELIAAGVSSFKIEGRLKTAEYVANITRHYRTAIDTALAGRPVAFTPREVEEMELSFSRGFSPGWLKGCDHKMLVPAMSSAKRGVRLGTVAAVRRGRVAVDLVGSVKRGDGVAFDAGATSDDAVGGRVFEVFQAGRSLTDPAAIGQVELTFGPNAFEFAVLKPGQAVWKTDDPALTSRLRKTFASGELRRQQPLDLVVSAAVGEPLRVRAKLGSGAECEVVSEEVAAEAEKHPLDEATLRAQLGRLGTTPFALRGLEARITGRPMLPLSVLGKVRREVIEKVGQASACHNKVGQASACHVEKMPRGFGGRGERIGQPQGYPTLHLLVRSLEQVRVVIALGERSLCADFADIRHYREAIEIARAAGAALLPATPRIQKPDELGIFALMHKQGPDGVLVRNFAALRYFRDRGLPVIADFSLNVTNELSAEFFLQEGVDRVTASYDMNREQLLALVAATPPGWLEVVIHQHMPMFHMEHCVFCAVLSPGTNKTNCGRPCDEHVVKLRDRIGVEHLLTADVGCRNTLYNAVPQSAAEVVPALVARGVGHYRVELLDESAEEIGRIVKAYRGLLAGEKTGREVWTRLNAANRVGVTRGTLEERRNPLAIL